MSIIARPTQENRSDCSIEPHVQIAETMILPVNRW